jgi:hypothetical protein
LRDEAILLLTIVVITDTLPAMANGMRVENHRAVLLYENNLADTFGVAEERRIETKARKL